MLNSGKKEITVSIKNGEIMADLNGNNEEIFAMVIILNQSLAESMLENKISEEKIIAMLQDVAREGAMLAIRHNRQEKREPPGEGRK